MIQRQVAMTATEAKRKQKEMQEQNAIREILEVQKHRKRFSPISGKHDFGFIQNRVAQH